MILFSFVLFSIIGLSLALSIGLLLNILACALWKKWWPIFSGMPHPAWNT